MMISHLVDGACGVGDSDRRVIRDHEKFLYLLVVVLDGKCRQSIDQAGVDLASMLSPD